MGRQYEEEYLLGQANHKSDIVSNDQSDIPGSFNDRNIHHKLTRKIGTQKYLRESCYYHIKCSITNSLAALMRN